MPGMRKSTRQELRKCRELLRFMLNHYFTHDEYIGEIVKAPLRITFHREKSRKILRVREDCGKKACFFCHKPIDMGESYAKDGDGQGSPISRKITIHHVNLKHEDDRDSNKRLSHSNCHRSFHASLRHKQNKSKRRIK